MAEKLKAERVKREVINSQLLTALDDKNNVAIVASKKDLMLLIRALKSYSGNGTAWEVNRMLADLERLYTEAFGQ